MRGDDALHLTRVLRAEAGRQYEISDSRQAYLAEIEEARGDRVVFRVVAPVDSPALPVRIALCAALVKFDRFEWMVEKATELGVERILPVETAKVEKGLPSNRAATDRVALLTGPEGGWTAAEREAAAAAGWRPASLGPLVLRAETAAMAAVAVIANGWMG